MGDHDAAQPTAEDLVVPPAPRRPLDDSSNPDLDPRSGALVLAGIVTLATTWFGVSWLVLDSPVVDAVGEAAGGVLSVLVLVSVVGAVRRSRRG